MLLSEIKNGKTYTITNINITKSDDLLHLQEMGILEGERILHVDRFKTSKNVILFKIDDQLFSVSKKMASNIEVNVYE